MRPDIFYQLTPITEAMKLELNAFKERKRKAKTIEVLNTIR